jgi:hypothetical protein
VDLEAKFREIVRGELQLVSAELIKALPDLLRAELQRQRQAEILGSDDLVARGYAKTVDAFNKMIQRAAKAKERNQPHAGLRLLAIAHEDSGRRYWLRTEVEQLELARTSR